MISIGQWLITLKVIAGFLTFLMNNVRNFAFDDINRSMIDNIESDSGVLKIVDEE